MSMGIKVRLSEIELSKLIRQIVEQTEDEGYFKITPQEYTELMKLSGYHGMGISRLPKFQGKPLWITGDVDLSGTPTDSLGNVGYIDGKLNIHNTNIKTLGNTKVKGYVQDYGTPIQKARIAKEQQNKRDEMESRREDGEWDYEGEGSLDDLGLKANALFEYLVSDGELKTLSEEEKNRANEIRNQIQQLENQENLSDDDEELIEELNDELNEILDEKTDVYVLYPKKYKHYGLEVFEILDGRRDEDWVVGTESEMDDAVLEYAKNYIDDVGIDGFTESFISDYIDEDYISDYFEDWWRDDIYSNPDIYFNEDDFELTDEQERRISEIEIEIQDYERQQEELDPDDEKYDDYYDDFQNFIDKLESEKEEIVPDTEPTDDMVERVLEERLDEVRSNPIRYIREYGLNLKDFVDEDELAKGLAESDGYGLMNSYDGDYDTIEFDDETYYIMRVS